MPYPVKLVFYHVDCVTNILGFFICQGIKITSGIAQNKIMHKIRNKASENQTINDGKS